MVDRRLFLAVLGSGVVTVTIVLPATAADTPSLREMQSFHYRRRRRYRDRPPMARRCVWTGWSRVCRGGRAW